MKLADFGVEAQVIEVHPGPVITLFEVDLAAGTKASKVTGLARDLARALSTISVRVVENMPGKTYIGLEIPNEIRDTVYLSEVLQSEVYEHAKSPLTLDARQGHRRQSDGGGPGARCPTCWWPAPRALASPWASTPWCSACSTRHAPTRCA